MVEKKTKKAEFYQSAEGTFIINGKEDGISNL